MTQTTFPSLPIISGETREGKLYLKYADGSEIEAGTLPDKTSLGLGNVENKSAAEILGGMKAEDVTGALGYVPVREDTQGVNLLTGTKDFSGDKWVTDYGKTLGQYTIMPEKYNGLSVVSKETQWGNLSQRIIAKAGEVYTLSLFAKSESETHEVQFNDVYNGPTAEIFNVDNTWRRYSYTRTVEQDGEYTIFMNSRESKRLYLCGLKLERGTVSNPIWTPAPEDVVTKPELPTSLNLILPKNAGAHNSIYRGNNLGTAVTEAQYSAISSGTFDDLFIGDYWTIDSVNWCIAAFDYLYNCGNTPFTQHHAVIVPDTCLYNEQMHKTENGQYEAGAANTTVGGYTGSDMYKTGLDTAKEKIKTAFSGHVLSHRNFLTNAMANGYASSGEWKDSEVDLMCEQMVYGCGIFSPVSNGTAVPANYRVEKSQLPLFALEPSRICNGENWWLRDVITASSFAYINNYGIVNSRETSYPFGVRPYFCIG